MIDWDLVSFLHRGKHRLRILEILRKPKTPTQVKLDTGLHFNVVSRAIIELQEKGFVKCLTPESKLSRIYVITKKGDSYLLNAKEILK